MTMLVLLVLVKLNLDVVFYLRQPMPENVSR